MEGWSYVWQPDWFLPLSSYRAMARRHCNDLIADGHILTFRGCRRYYRMARDGMIFVRPGTLTIKQ